MTRYKVTFYNENSYEEGINYYISDDIHSAGESVSFDLQRKAFILMSANDDSQGFCYVRAALIASFFIEEDKE